MARFWTPERVFQLQALEDERTPRHAIAATLGTTIHAVEKKLSSLRCRALGDQYTPRERGAPLPQASEEAVSALYAGRRYDDVKLKPSTQDPRLWPHRYPEQTLSGCGLDMLPYNSGRRAGGAGRSAG